MADNLDNYADVDALPRFDLFPWFFVAPGLLLIGLALVARSSRRATEDDPPDPTPGGPMKRERKTTKAAAVIVMATLAVMIAAPLHASAGVASKKAKALVGVFGITAGECAATPTGSYFRMVQPNGTVDAGPYVDNGDSTCADKSYTALSPGTDGGLVTGAFQAQPEPPFDAAGNGIADAITQPQKFFGVTFALATNKTDPQTSEGTKKPTIKAKGKKLKGDLRALGVAYGKQHFNQGAPKPDGSKPSGTAGPTGTYNAKTGEYTLDWSSAIVGGPFDGFTGIWHLEGTFEKK
jgi:hypothetical protein